MPVLEPATKYYWRVRVYKPLLSPWSDKCSFTTSLSNATNAIQVYSPEPGASQVSLVPVFQWSPVSGAERYELLVSTDISFTNPTIAKSGDHALPATAWQCDTALDYDTTYYWKVRGINPESYSAWSAVTAFTTESAPKIMSPSSTVSPDQSSTSSYNPATSPPDWVMWLVYLGGALLLVMLATLIVVIMLTIRISKR